MELNMEIVRHHELNSTEKLVWHLREMGHSLSQIAKLMNMSERNISRATKVLNQTDTSGRIRQDQTNTSGHSCPNQTNTSGRIRQGGDEPNIIFTNSFGVSKQNPTPPPTPQPREAAAAETKAKIKHLVDNPEPSIEEWEDRVDPSLWRSSDPRTREEAAIALTRLMRHPDKFERVIGAPLLDPDPDFDPYPLWCQWCDRVGRLGFNRLNPNELREVFTLIHRHPHWNEGGRWTMDRLKSLVYKATRKMDSNQPMFRDPLRLIQLTQRGEGQDLAFKILIDGKVEGTVDLRDYATIGRN